MKSNVVSADPGVKARADLSGAYLSRADLSRADLSGADLDAEKTILLQGQRPVTMIGPIGSRGAYLTAFVTCKGVFVKTGCFFGTLAEFTAKVFAAHQKNEHAKEYRAAMVLIRAHAKLWTPKTK